MEFTRTIRKGMSGKDVALAKARLFELGCYDPKITSIKKDSYGSDTVSAVRRFQNKNGLQVDGVIGAETWGALFGNEISAPVISDSTLLDTILNLCDEQVKNGSLFVWASSGELGTKVSEATIRKREARSNGGAHADRAVEMWEKRLSQGNTVFRIFDCSGFVSWILSQAKVFSGRRDCDGLWSLCARLDKPTNGALLFRVNSDNSEDETHVGLYFNGYQYHAKGRDYGVVKEKYKASSWQKIGWFKAIPKG